MNKPKKLLAMILALAMIATMMLTPAIAGDDAADDYGIAPVSLLPLNTTYVTIDLGERFADELRAYPVQTLIDTINTKIEEQNKNISDKSKVYTISSDVEIAWAIEPHPDSYERLDLAGTIDLLGGRDYVPYSTTLRLITGKYDQLNLSNHKFNVTIYFTEIEDLFKLKVWNATDGTEMTVYSENGNSYYADKLSLYARINEDSWTSNDIAVSIIPTEEFDASEYTLKFYEGEYETEKEANANGAVDITDTIWNKSDAQSAHQYTAENHRLNSTVTLFMYRGENLVLHTVIDFSVYRAYSGIDIIGLYSLNEEGKLKSVRYSSGYDSSTGTRLFLLDGLSTTENYYLALRYSDTRSEASKVEEPITKAVVGYYETIESAAEAPDIKDQLFPASIQNSYSADFSQGIEFTVFDAYGKIYHLKYKTEAKPVEPDPEPTLSSDTSFYIYGAYSADGYLLKSYTMSGADDAAYADGYQTLFVLGANGPYTEDEIIPRFSSGYKATVKASIDEDGESATLQISEETKVPFQSGKPIHYTAYAEDGVNAENYWVTFLTQEAGGGKLYVNGTNDPTNYQDNMPARILKLIYDDDHHDVFIANIGDEDLTNLSVSIEDAKNVALNDYWTIGETKTLGAFTSAYSSEMKNIAKIRLLRDVDADGNPLTGPISGTLVISADDNDPVRIKLTGVAGVPKITTKELSEAVKWVPYSTGIQTSCIGDPDAVAFELIDGTLPEGVELRPNGEIYGVPQETGEFSITVRAKYKDYPTIYDEATFVLTVVDNTDENVWNATDTSYDITTAIPNQDGTVTIAGMNIGENNWANGTITFVSQGEFSNFVALWLDGVKLEQGVDYQAESGSTRITISTQTLSEGEGFGGEDGSDEKEHTIAMEFREGDSETGELKRASQNYKTGGEEPESTPTTAPEATPEPTPVPTATPAPVATADPSPAPTDKVETKNNSDGSTSVITTKPDKTVITRTTDKDGNVVEETVYPSGTVETKYYMVDGTKSVTTEKPNSAVTSEVTVPVAVVEQASRKHVTLPMSKLPVTNDLKTAASVTIKTDAAGVFKVAIPLETTTPGTVAFLVKDDGTTEVIITSYTKDGYLITPIPEGGGTVKIVDNTMAFTDTEEHWAADAISFVSARGLFVGIGNGLFAPDSSMNRAMLMTVLAHYDKENTDGGSTWYEKGLRWAIAKGITDGTNPDRTISRQELVTMMHNYAGKPASEGRLESFSDSDEIADWASPAMQWAAENGLIVGSNDALNPNGEVTRAQAAAIIEHYIEEIDN